MNLGSKTIKRLKVNAICNRLMAWAQSWFALRNFGLILGYCLIGMIVLGCSSTVSDRDSRADSQESSTMPNDIHYRVDLAAAPSGMRPLAKDIQRNGKGGQATHEFLTFLYKEKNRSPWKLEKGLRADPEIHVFEVTNEGTDYMPRRAAVYTWSDYVIKINTATFIADGEDKKAIDEYVRQMFELHGEKHVMR